VNNKSTSSTTQRSMTDALSSQSKSRAMAPLWLRLILAVTALVCLATSTVTALNLYAVNVYNEATETLNETVKLSKQQGVDPKTIELRQRQTDELFNRLGKLDPLLLGEVKRAISTNAKVSTQLTTTTRNRIAKIDKTQRKSSSTNSSNGTGGKRATGLTDEQRKAVEETLKANQPSSSNAQNQNNDESSNSQPKNVKPW
jgi:hypothetical protein